ncbi:MAG: hypothetical protein DSY60_01405 [Persephonella sp.]|nr:MAG: hypothetical protein DSY60_01405 [Persephonella sp.]
MPFKKILVGIDFSNITESVINSALFFGKIFNSEVCLLHVIEPPIIAIYEDPFLSIDNKEVVIELEELLVEKFKKELEKFKIRFDEAGVKTTVAVEVGNIVDTILDYAETNSFDLITVGSHSEGLLERLILGSITERVLNKTKISTLVVKGEPIKKIDRILCGYDFLPNSIKALETALEIAEITKAEVEVLHAEYDAWISHLTSVYEEVYKKKENLLKSLEKEINERHNINIKTKIERGAPEKVILKEIKGFNPDITVLGKRKIKDLERVLIGTVAMKVVKNSPKSVLIVKRREN